MTLHQARDILVVVLRQWGPLKGARLKQLMQFRYAAETGRPFDQRSLGYERFVDFVRQQRDLVTLKLPQGPGDIEVNLGADMSVSPATEPDRTHTRVGTGWRGHRLPSPLWQAFTNPDPARKRFVRRSTGEVIHYIEQDESPYAKALQARVKDAPADYCEIECIRGEDHKAWMREFLDTNEVVGKEYLNRVLEDPYSSDLNHQFTSMLGDAKHKWTAFRVENVVESVRRWAERNETDFTSLLEPGRESNAAVLHSHAPQEVRVPPSALDGAGSPLRHALVAALNSLDEDRLVDVWQRLGPLLHQLTASAAAE